MKLLEYKVIKSDNPAEIGLINNIVLFESQKDIEENQNYVEQGCDNSTLAGQRWNDYLYEQTGLVDEDVFYFMSAGEETPHFELDGVEMELVK